MKIYQVDAYAKPPRSKFDYYAQLDCKGSDNSFLNPRNFDGRPFPKKWRQVRLHFDEPLWPRADFCHIQPGIFVCSEKARIAIEPVISASGEFLPVLIEGEAGQYFIFNATDCGNYIDPAETIWQCNTDYPEDLADPTTAILASPAFNPKKLKKHPIFKIPQENQIYCQDSFKELVERHRLVGLRFRMIWSENGGPVPLCRPPGEAAGFIWKRGNGKDYRRK